MEANFFRFLAAELRRRIVDRRIDKVFAPSPGVWTVKLQNMGAPLHLLFRPAKSAGHLFLSSTKPDNPPDASAQAMWFRKRLRNRKIIGTHDDWPNLRLALELSPRNTPPCGRFLVFDVRNGLELQDELDDAFFAQPEWPAFEDALEDENIWRAHPHLSPPLRAVLKNLPGEDAHRLYVQMAIGAADRFHLPRRGEAWQPPLAWDVPGEANFDTALDAANAYGERTLFPLLDVVEGRPGALRFKRERKRLRRNLARIDDEEARLGRMADDKLKAEALQAQLYRIKNEEGLKSVEVEHPEAGPMIVPLNSHLTPTENMERYFKLAAKAARGFLHIQRRRAELRQQLADLERGDLPPAPEPKRRTAATPTKLPKRYAGMAVTVFRSSDGFTLIRGKNKKANHDILSKAASGFDLWFHLADGPSSHVILRRDHPNQDIPERTLNEAAVLCALKSHRKDDRYADVMYALVKDVRKVKGFAHGQVMVDKRQGTLRVTPDPDLEKQLS